MTETYDPGTAIGHRAVPGIGLAVPLSACGTGAPASACGGTLTWGRTPSSNWEPVTSSAGASSLVHAGLTTLDPAGAAGGKVVTAPDPSTVVVHQGAADRQVPHLLAGRTGMAASPMAFVAGLAGPPAFAAGLAGSWVFAAGLAGPWVFGKEGERTHV